MARIVGDAYSYDDVLITPKYNKIRSRKQVDLTTRITRNFSIALPILAANMDTVCESQMAISIGKLGGLGVIHRFMKIEEQASEVKKVKMHHLITAADGYLSNADITGLSQTVDEHYTQHSAAIQTILSDLDGYALDSNLTGLNNTVQEHYNQQGQINQDIIKDLDGYATVSPSGSAADGYVAFFTGTNAIAGDNDLFWDRPNNRLGIGTSSPSAPLTVSSGPIHIADGSISAPGIAFANTQPACAARLGLNSVQ